MHLTTQPLYYYIIRTYVAFILVLLLFASTMTLSYSNPDNVLGIKNIVVNQLNEKSFTATPVSPEETPTYENKYFPQISSQHVAVYDRNSEHFLYEHAGFTPTYPASTTKILTALIAIETYEMTDVLTVPADIYTTAPGSSMKLLPEERITVEHLLYGLLINSGNDAAHTLAVNHPSGYEGFIADMRILASTLHLSHTTIENVVGYDSGNHFMSARDLALVADFALDNQFIRNVALTKENTLVNRYNKNREIVLKSTNPLLGVEGVYGLKTGSTLLAGETLVTAVERGNMDVVIVVMRSYDRSSDSQKLLNWVVDTFNW